MHFFPNPKLFLYLLSYKIGSNTVTNKRTDDQLTTQQVPENLHDLQSGEP